MIAFLAAFGAASASAANFGFGCITGNEPGDCAIGEAQLGLGVTDPGGSQVTFTFTNTGSDAAVIAQVYFDDGVLASISSIAGSAGVSFSSGASPPNLPGGNSISPAFSATFSAGANPPPPTNGVGPGEQLDIVFSLASGKTFADVLAALGDESLRVGVHVQAFASGGSESFVNSVPEAPATALLALVLLSLIRSRR